MNTSISAVVALSNPSVQNAWIRQTKPYPFINVVGKSNDVAGTVELILRHRPGLVFLEVGSQSLNGFEVINTVRTLGMNPYFILISTTDDCAVRAFDVGVLDFVSMTINSARIRLAIQRVLESTQAENANNRDADIPTGILVRSASEFRLIAFADIHAVTASDKLTELWSSGNSYLLDESLDQLEQRLPELQYIRIHRSALCRVGSIDSVNTNGQGHYELTLKDSACPTLRVARRRYRSLLDRLAA